MVHFNDRYSSFVQMAIKLEQIEGRGNNQAIKLQVDAMEQQVKALTPEPKPTVGPTPYEQEAAAEGDGWEVEE